MKRLFILMMAASCHTIALAQANTDWRKVVPPSPETSNLFRYVDHPVNYSTGVPSISVPLYEVQSGTLKVPISINYHSGGRKASDDTGPVGLGWSLIAGGSISRTIYGKPDDYTSFPYGGVTPAPSLTNQNDYLYLQDLYEPYTITDSEYDIFSYTFPGYSGKFLISDDKQTVHMMPIKPLKFPTTSGYGFPGIIVDDKGTEFHFDETESYNGDFYYSGAATGVFLTKMISANKKDTITFHYTGFSKLNGYPSESYTRYDDIYDNGTVPASVTGHSQFSTLHTEQRIYIVKRLSEIRWREGKVVFNLVGGNDRVSNIQILNKDAVVIKTIQLVMSVLDNAYSVSHPNNYKLDTLKFKDRNNKDVEKYAFDYYGSGNFNRMSRDFWGYRNGSTQTHGVPSYNNVLIRTPPSGSGYITAGSGAYRGSGLSSRAGVLSKITYPTGGTTEFLYELNRFMWHNISHDGNGLRIAEIRTTGTDGQVQFKTYRYGVNESGYGTISFVPEMYDMTHETRFLTDIIVSTTQPSTAYGYARRIFSSEVLPELAYMLNEPVYYSEVAEYTGTLNSNIGKTVYKYTWGNYANTILGSYPTPTLNQLPGHMSLDPALIPRTYIREFNLWNEFTLGEEAYYKNNGNNTYQMVRKKNYYYTRAITDTVNGTHIYKFLEVTSPGGIVSGEQWAAEHYAMPVFVYADYFHTIGYLNLTHVSETDYSTSGQLTNTTTLSYNNRHLVSEKRHMMSTGDERVTQTKYPFDYPSTTVYQDMTNRHMLNFSIEETELKNSTFLRATKNNYNDYGNHIIDLITTETKQGAGAYETRVRYHGFDDRGNLLSVSKETDVRHSFIYGYNKTYPIAEVVNGGTLTSAYTSFEANSPGNWTIGGSARNSTDARTGKVCYELSGGALSISGLDPTKTYILSYWAKPGATHSATGTTSTAQGASHAGWNQWEKTISGVSSTTLSGSGLFDEVRLYPKGALMNTFAYEPLVGMINKCDQRNAVTYYEYDASNRLTVIRDDDKNIVKKICYNYYNEAQDCTGLPTAPLWLPTGMVRCKACPQNAAYITNIQQKQLRDMNSASPTYLTFMWVDVGVSTTCVPAANWQNTATAQRCEKDANNNNTGYLEREQLDMNPCSPTANQTRWIRTTFNSGTCPGVWYNSDMSGYYVRQCDPGYTGTSVYVSMPAGSYSSTISPQHAGTLAYNAAQAIANSTGSCTYLGDVSFSFSNNSPEHWNIDFYNTTTGITYSFTMYNNQSGSLGPVPSGNYDITIYNGNYIYNYYFSICGGGYSSYGMDASFYNVNLTPSCSSININF